MLHNVILLEQIRCTLNSRCQMPQIRFVHIHFGNQNVEFTSTAALFFYNGNHSRRRIFMWKNAVISNT